MEWDPIKILIEEWSGEPEAQVVTQFIDHLLLPAPVRNGERKVGLINPREGCRDCEPARPSERGRGARCLASLIYTPARGSACCSICLPASLPTSLTCPGSAQRSRSASRRPLLCGAKLPRARTARTCTSGVQCRPWRPSSRDLRSHPALAKAAHPAARRAAAAPTSRERIGRSAAPFARRRGTNPAPVASPRPARVRPPRVPPLHVHH